MKKFLSVLLCLSLVLSLTPAISSVKAATDWIQTFTGYDGTSAPEGFSTGAAENGVTIYGTGGLFGKTAADTAFTHDTNPTDTDAPSGWQTYPQWNMNTSLNVTQFGANDIFCWGFEFALNSYYGHMDIRLNLTNTDGTGKTLNFMSMGNNQKGKLTCMSQTITSEIPLNTWVNLDFVLRTYNNTLDIYYNGEKVIEKLDLSSSVGTSATKTIGFYRMFMFPAKADGAYVNTIKYLDNFYAKVVTEEPTITINSAVSSSDKVTVDEANKLISADDSLTAESFKSSFTLPEGASVEVYSASGAAQTQALTDGIVYIKSASGKYSYYTLKTYTSPDTVKTYPLSLSTNADSILFTMDGETSDLGNIKKDNYPMGKQITLTAVNNDENKTFMYWKDESGIIVSTTEQYSFITGSGASLSAVYADKTLGSFVTFKNANGRILASGQTSSGITVPQNPYIMGYTFDGWYTGTTPALLNAGDTLDSIEADTLFSAGYKKSTALYTVTVNSEEKTYAYNESVTVSAEDTDENGNPFMYWTKNSDIVSFDKTYTFYVNGDSVLEAVYGTGDIESDIIVNLATPVAVDRNKLAFFAEFDLPEKYTVVEMGILLGQSDSLSVDNYIHKGTSSSKNNKHQFTIRKANLKSGDTWYGRAYVIYSDEDGNTVTGYSDTVSKTLVIIDPITALEINTPTNLEQNETARQAVVFSVTTTPATDIDTSTIEWYVNGSVQTNTSENNTEFTYTPASVGTYEVYAKVSGSDVVSQTKTIVVNKADAADVVELNEQFNYSAGYNFATSLPAAWTALNITGNSADTKASACVAVDTDIENPENLVLKQLAPYEQWQSNRLDKKLSGGIGAPIVLTGLAKMSHISSSNPTFSITLYSGVKGNKQIFSFSPQADGRINGTNGIIGYITNDSWVRYTALITVNSADLTKSSVKYMLSGNGNVSKTNGGAGTYITTDTYTVDLSGASSLDTSAPTFRFAYGYSSSLGSQYYSYHDDIRIYYPKVLKASVNKSENVFIDDAIEVSFNHNVDPLTLTDENIILRNVKTGEEISKKLEFDPLSVYGVKIIPSQDLSYFTDYTVEFSADVTDIAGLSVSAPVSFTTQAEPDENSIRLNTTELTAYEDSTDSSVEVYLNNASASSDMYTVKSDNTAVADWSDGKVICGEAGSAVLSFVSADKTSKAKLTVKVLENPRAADYVNTISIPSETVDGDIIVYMTEGALNTEWTTSEGTAPYTVSDSVIGTDVMAFAGATDYSTQVFLEASSKYVLETNLLAASSADGVQLKSNIGSLFKLADSSEDNKKTLYLGASDTSSLELEENIWYHLKAILTTDENFRVSEIRYFVDNAEVYQENQAYDAAQISSFGVYNESAGTDEILRLDSLNFYKTQENEIASYAIPSETVEGDIIYENHGSAESWDYVSSAPTSLAYEYAPSTDILNTVTVIKNATRSSMVYKYLDLEPNSTYIYETKMKLLDGADGFKIKFGAMPLITVNANDSQSKTVLFGNSVSSNGYTLPTDSWFVFKAVINLDEGEKVSAVSYYINGTEVYQEGQEPVAHYDEANKFSYINENISSGEAVRLDDTYIYKTLWLTGVTADIFELQASGEEFDTASQITRPGEAELVLTLNNGTRLATQPKVVVDYYDAAQTLLSSDTADVESEIEAGGSTTFTMSLSVPDGVAGGSMKINVYDSTGTEQLTQPIEKTLNTGGVLFLESIYGNNSVIQRDMPVVISGISPSGSTVTAEFAGTSVSTVAANNRFSVTLPAQEASFENRTLTITATADGFSETKTIENVQVGDVYYASGQSNMDWQMRNTTYGDHTIPENVRYIKMAYTTTAGERVDRHLYNGAALSENWSELNDSTINGCAAVMFFMAQKIRNSGVDVPIGIIDCSLGGTSISAWVGEDVFKNEEAYASYYQKYINGDENIGALYNFMFKPISSYTFKAMVWYQGEQDFASAYEKLLPPMVNQYRSTVGRDFPIMVVQLPGLNHVYRDIRFRQAYAVSTLDDAYLIVTNDTGDAVDVHPQNKDVVGDRLARVALNKLYGMDIAYSGPTFKTMTVDGAVATLEFDNVSDDFHGGLCSMNEDSSLPGFELAGADGKFYSAEAVIDGDTVKLTSSSVSEPVYARYGYVGEIFTSLGNDTDGYMLPAGCFRTDGKF